jgi:hypothetical protein
LGGIHGGERGLLPSTLLPFIGMCVKNSTNIGRGLCIVGIIAFPFVCIGAIKLMLKIL